MTWLCSRAKQSKIALLFFVIVLAGANSTVVSAQQFRVHKTNRTIRFQMDNITQYDLGNCVGGVFVAHDKNAGISYIIDTLGNTLGAVELDVDSRDGFFPNFFGEVATALYKGGICGIIKKDGSGVTAYPNEDVIGISSRFVDGAALIRIQNNNGTKFVAYINEEGDILNKELIFVDPDPFSRFSNRLARPLSCGLRAYYDSNNKKYGFIDTLGNIVIPPTFLDVHDFSEDLAAVSNVKNGVIYWGFINTKGEYEINPIFRNEPRDFHNGYARVFKMNKKQVFIDKTGEVKSIEYDRATDFFEGYAIIGDNGVGGYMINSSFAKTGNLEAKWFYENNVKYNHFNQTFLMDNRYFYPDGKLKIWPAERGSLIRDFVEDIALYSCNDYYGYINSRGEVLMFFVQSEF